MPELGSAVFRIVTDAKDFYTNLKKMETEANAAATSTGKSFKSVDKQVAATGKQMSLFGDRVDESTGQLHLFDEGVGKSTRTLKEHGQQVDNVTRRLNPLRRAVSDLGTRWRATASDTDRAGSKLDRVITKITKLNAVFKFLGTAFKLVKWPALIAAAGLAVQALAQLALGATALVNALAPAGGAVVSLAQGFLAFKQAQGVFKLGMMGMKDATKEWKKELQKSTPETTKFAAKLKAMTPDIVRLRNLAQKPLLGGLTKGIDAAKANLPVLNGIVQRTGAVLGHFFTQAGKLVGSKSFGRDLAQIGSTNSVVLGRMGASVLHLVKALANLMIAADPLTRWLSKTVLLWSKQADAATHAGRENGKLGAFFDRTRGSLERLFSITGNLVRGLLNIAKASRSAGNTLLGSLDKTIKNWADWTGSLQGQNKLKQYFDRAVPGVLEMGRLVRDITKAFLRIGNTPGLVGLSQQIRTKLLPVVEKLITGTEKALGPTLIASITSIARVVGDLAGSSGPLVIFLKTLGKIADAIHWLLTNVPGLQSAFVTLAAAASIYKALQIGAAITGLKRIKSMITGLGPVVAAENAVSGGGLPIPGGGTTGHSPGKTPSRFSKFTSAASAAARVVAPIAIVGAGAYEAEKSREGQKLNDQQKTLDAMRQIARQAPTTGAALKQMLIDAGSATHKLSRQDFEELRRKIVSLSGVKLTLVSPDGTKDANKFLGFADQIIDRVRMLKGFKAIGLHIDLNAPETRTQLANVGAAFTTLKRSAGGSIDDIKTNLRLFRQAVTYNMVDGSAEAKAATADGFNAAAREIKGAMARGAISTKDGMALIDHYLRAALAEYGIKGKQASSYISGTKAGGQSAFHGGDPSGPMRGVPKKNAAGAVYVGGPGQVGQDNVPAVLNGRPALVARGEMVAVVNRHQQAALNAGAFMLGYGGLDDLMGSIHRPHYMATGGTIPRQTVSGLGLVGQAATAGLDRVRTRAQKIVDRASAEASLGGGGAVNTHGLVAQVKRALAWARAHGWRGGVTSGFRSDAEQVRIWNAGIRPAAKPKALGGPGSNHSLGQAVDVSDIPGFARAMASAPPKARLYSRVPGDPEHFSVTGHARGGLFGRLASGGLSQYNKIFPATSLGRPGRALPVKVVRAIFEAAGFSPKTALQMAQITHGESGYHPGIISSDGGIGLAQNTPRVWGAAALKYMKKLGGRAALRNPLKNAKMARYLFKQAGYSFAPWFGTKYLQRNIKGNVKSVLGSFGSAGGPGGGPVLKHLTQPLYQTKLGLQLAHGTHMAALADAGGPATPSSEVPNEIAGALVGQRDVYRSQYKTASRTVQRLTKRMRTKGLGKKGRAKLSTAMETASTALQNIDGVNDQITQFNDTYSDSKSKKILTGLGADLEQAKLNGDDKKQADVLNKIWQQRLKMYQTAVISKDPNRIVEAAQNLNQASDDLAAIMPTARDSAEAALAQANLTPEIGDNIAALTDIDKIAHDAYVAAVASGDPKKIKEAADDYASAHQALVDAVPTALDYANAALAQAGLTDSIDDDIAALTDIDHQYYQAYQDAVLSGDPRQIAQAATDYANAHQQLLSIVPTAMDYAQASLGNAGLTNSITDDIAAMKQVDALAYSSYQEALASGDPKRIAQAASDYQSAHQQLIDLEPNAFDFADLALARAEMTEDTADDIDAWRQVVAARAQELDDANRTDDPRKIAAALRNLKSAQDQLDQLTGAGGGRPSVVNFASRLPESIIRGLVGPGNVGSNVTVQQYFTKAPADNFTYLRSAQFAATAVFSG